MQKQFLINRPISSSGTDAHARMSDVNQVGIAQLFQNHFTLVWDIPW
jgi:hypothetical protein